jgi:hypothetical protein
MSAQIIPIEFARLARQPAAPVKKPKTERQSRWTAWMDADAETEKALAWFKYQRATDRVICRAKWAAGLEHEFNHEADQEASRAYHVALQRQLRTPAYNKATLLWKKRQIGERHMQWHCSVATMDHIKELIAEDEAWLEANKPKRYRLTNSADSAH